VYVASFPGAGGKRQISTDGGGFPRWRGDGTEIFYLDRDKRLVAARVDGRGAAFTVGGVRTLFQTRARDGVYSFDVSADGQRFLVNTVVEQDTVGSVVIVVNWPARSKEK
jgi:eukaryotic-like serine/threonine-protein kinase